MTIKTNQTLSEWLAIHEQSQPDAPALLQGDMVMSYAELGVAVRKFSSGLAKIGIGKGDVVGVQLPNIPSFIIAFLAIVSRGAIIQTLHMPYRSKELSGLLKDSGAKAVIVTAADENSRAGDVLSVKDTLPNLEHIIAAGRSVPDCFSLTELMQTPENDDSAVSLSSNDPYLLLYTSGTTAAPKGVPHVYKSFLNNAFSASSQLSVGESSRVLSLAPMTHLYGVFTTHLALAAGAAIVLVPNFNPNTVLDDLKSSLATHVFAAPAHFSSFVSQGLLLPKHFAKTELLCLSGAPVPYELAEAVDKTMPNGGVIQLWGMSELQAGAFGRPGDPAIKRFSSAGRAAEETTLRIVDDAEQLMGPNTEGALQVRGPSIFAGYLDRPEETERAFSNDGWFSTGDLGKLDDEGYLTITGRIKEVINRGGVKFSPAEVEEVLLSIPCIQQCAIVPIPDPDLGERGCLCVQLEPDTALTLKDVTDVLAASGMAKFKWPEKLVALEALPLTPTRKVMRAELSKLIQNTKEI